MKGFRGWFWGFWEFGGFGGFWGFGDSVVWRSRGFGG